MKYLIFFFASILMAQTPVPGTIVVSSNIVATAGAAGDPNQIVCTGTASVSASVSSMTMQCVVGGTAFPFPLSTFTVPATGGRAFTFGVNAGVNSITWMLSKGNAIPDQWQVSANGVLQTGAF